MHRIVVGGQLYKKEIADFITNYFGSDSVEISIKNDLDAVNAIRMGQYDYYIGACNTGGGGALAMAIALLGFDSCKTISMPGRILPDNEIVDAVNQGKVAFGFTAEHAEKVLPVLLKSIKEKKG